MMTLHSNADRTARKIRKIADDAEPLDAVHATWRVALIKAVQVYGPAMTANALRDLADEIERDLIASVREGMQ